MCNSGAMPLYTNGLARVGSSMLRKAECLEKFSENLAITRDRMCAGWLHGAWPTSTAGYSFIEQNVLGVLSVKALRVHASIWNEYNTSPSTQRQQKPGWREGGKIRWTVDNNPSTLSLLVFYCFTPSLGSNKFVPNLRKLTHEPRAL